MDGVLISLVMSMHSKSWHNAHQSYNYPDLKERPMVRYDALRSIFILYDTKQAGDTFIQRTNQKNNQSCMYFLSNILLYVYFRCLPLETGESKIKKEDVRNLESILKSFEQRGGARDQQQLVNHVYQHLNCKIVRDASA